MEGWLTVKKGLLGKTRKLYAQLDESVNEVLFYNNPPSGTLHPISSSVV
jgi:hypothetical protein